MIEKLYFSFQQSPFRRCSLVMCILIIGSSTHLAAQKLDFGDAPDSYGTLLSSNGARHTPFTRVYLGGSFGGNYDAESDGQPGPLADGDDSHDGDGNITYYQSDEDGVVNGSFSAVCVSRDKYTLEISVYNNSGADATVSAWIDFNRNGTFDTNERTQAVVPTTPSLTHYNGTSVTLTWSGMSGLTEGWTYARLRVANNAAEVTNPTGFANTGEVEDYRVHLKDEYDFGDAPESYGTMLKDNGACHLINNNVMLLGPLDCSAEDDGQSSVMADADAGENSVSFPYKLTTAKTSYSVRVNVLNTSGGNAMLCGWIDFNRNGTFDTNERADMVIGSDTRNVVLNWTKLSGMTTGRTYARFRVATNADEISTPTGMANNGSVEDYTLMIEAPQYDFGDAPDSYGTLVSSNGARHVFNDVESKLCLSNGAIANNIDAEADGQVSAQATGDNAASSDFGFPLVFDDETGLVTPPSLTANSTSCSAVLSVRNQTGANATLSGWIDFNRNGTFDNNERAQVSVPFSENGSLIQVTLIWNGLSGLAEGQTFMRFRIASSASDVESPTGAARDGEVEDYSLTVVSAAQAPLPVNLVSFQGQWIENEGNQLSWVTSWERDNNHFDIQRSRDARNFETVGRVNGKGTTSSAQTYTYLDQQTTPAELTYYRLKQVDLDGRISYSRIISVRHEQRETLAITVYPNPTTEQLSLRLSLNQQVGRAQVYTIGGVLVLNEEGTEKLDVRALPTGIYVVEVTTATGEVLRQRFIKR